MTNYIRKLLLLSFIFMACNAQANEPIKIYINQLIAHPALDKTAQGIMDTLDEYSKAKSVKIELKLKNAQGDSKLANQISSRFVSNNPDIVVGIATISAQSLAKYAKSGKTKLVFSTVTDPIAAGLVTKLQSPGGNITGVSNYIDLEPQLGLFKNILPSMQKIGFIYNPGESNSVIIAEKLDKICQKMKIKLVKITAAKSSDVPQAAMKLCSEVDAVFISNDNTALSAIKSIIKEANKYKIPVFVSDTDAVKDGAIAALGPNQYEIGKQTAEIIIQVIEGKNIGQIDVQYPKSNELYLNVKAAKVIDINFSQELLEKAKNVIY
ncbi:MAG: ABC transporter substrate-binding protein [Rickettsiales bacterium]|nr:ABC transporter substrate-binding protein [Rickettsiales bacterium]